jgi:hypothetical protein
VTEKQRQKAIRKIAEEPFEMQSIARVGWTPGEIVRMAKVYDLRWTKKEAKAFLVKHTNELEDGMLTAGLITVTKGFQK